MYKLLSSSANSTELLYGFVSNMTHRRQELRNNKEAGQNELFNTEYD